MHACVGGGGGGYALLLSYFGRAAVVSKLVFYAQSSRAVISGPLYYA